MKRRLIPSCLAAAFTLAVSVFPVSGIAATPQTGDGWILTALAFVMERDGRLSPGRVNASCHNGVVALQGTVLTEEDRGVAEQLTMLIPGVRGIKNNLSVAPTFDGNDRVAREIRSILVENPSIQIRALNVRARDGVVTLTGAVEDRRQRRLADRLVMMAPHVRRVVDRLTVLRPV